MARDNAMQPDLSLPEQGTSPLQIPVVWRGPLATLAVAWLAIVLLFLPDWGDMAHQWWDASTYNHILLVPPILAWLVMMRKQELLKLEPRAWWPGLIPFAGALFLWVLGNISGLNLASHLGLVVMMQAAVLTLLGPVVTWALFFPVLYMLFLVPFGDMLVPPLQMITADITIALTHFSGIPAEIDGVFIDTPVGLFEVAEACSGVKFLIAMIALGTLVAHVCYVDWRRRLIFMIVAVVLPIVANGVRAWGTIYIAQSQGIEFASGFDHIFYGWVFFAVVMVILLGMGWRFFDRPLDDRFIDAEAIRNTAWLRWTDRFSVHGLLAVVAMGAIMLGGLAWGQAARALDAPMPRQLHFTAPAGWTMVDYTPAVWWEPRAAGADHRLMARYRDAAGHEVDVFFALYSGQDDGREAGGFGEGALVPDTPWRWQEPAAGPAEATAEWLQANGNVRRLAYTWYRSGDLLTGSNSRLKLANMADRLLMREQATAVLILSAEHAGPGAQPTEAIDAFLAGVGPVGSWMDRLAQLP